MQELPENSDLAWDLGEIHNRERAIDFIMRFETTLCVYSPSVEQIYSTYNIFFPKEYDRKLVILPDPAAFHDTFNGVTSNSIKPTGLYIIPGELIGKSGLYLTNTIGERDLGTRQLPFTAAMKAIMAKRSKDDPFIPILGKGDLREFENDWPILHMHRVQLSALTHMSGLDKTNIKNGVLEKLDSLFSRLEE
ncbi:MAG: hypothetical protein KUG75_04005 [Pseudomonadales bacterium]|nr:hypothetical protein [Pseudomonadales bacterium]